MFSICKKNMNNYIVYILNNGCISRWIMYWELKDKKSYFKGL